MVCSATATAFPVGALTTITPRRVAASTSMLSTPVPARPITRRCSPASITEAVTGVALRGEKLPAGDVVYRVTVELDEPDPELRWGMTVRITIPLE